MDVTLQPGKQSSADIVDAARASKSIITILLPIIGIVAQQYNKVLYSESVGPGFVTRHAPTLCHSGMHFTQRAHHNGGVTTTESLF